MPPKKRPAMPVPQPAPGPAPDTALLPAQGPSSPNASSVAKSAAKIGSVAAAAASTCAIELVLDMGVLEAGASEALDQLREGYSSMSESAKMDKFRKIVEKQITDSMRMCLNESQFRCLQLEKALAAKEEALDEALKDLKCKYKELMIREREFEELKNRLEKDVEIWSDMMSYWRKEYDEGEAKRRKLEESLEKERADKEKALDLARKFQDKMKTWKTKAEEHWKMRDKIMKDHNDLRKGLDTLRSGVDELQKSKEKLTETKEEMEDEIEKLKKEVSISKESERKLSKELELSKAESVQLKSALESTRKSTAEELSRLKELHTQDVKEIDRLKKVNQSLKCDYSDTESKLEALGQDIVALNAQMEILKQKLRSSEESMSKHQQELSTLRDWKESVEFLARKRHCLNCFLWGKSSISLSVPSS